MPATIAVKPSDIAPQQTATLDATHRCDACQSKAYVQVPTIHGVFLFCSHHYNKHQNVLFDLINAEVLDERWSLNAVTKLDVSA